MSAHREQRADRELDMRAIKTRTGSRVQSVGARARQQTDSARKHSTTTRTRIRATHPGYTVEQALGRAVARRQPVHRHSDAEVVDVVVLDVAREVLEEERDLQVAAAAHAVLKVRPRVRAVSVSSLHRARPGRRVTLLADKRDGCYPPRRTQQPRTAQDPRQRSKSQQFPAPHATDLERVLAVEQEEAKCLRECDAHGVSDATPRHSSSDSQHGRQHGHPLTMAKTLESMSNFRPPMYHTTATYTDCHTSSYHLDMMRCSTTNVGTGRTHRKPSGENAKRYSARWYGLARFHCASVHGSDWLYCLYLVLLLRHARSNATSRARRRE